MCSLDIKKEKKKLFKIQPFIRFKQFPNENFLKCNIKLKGKQFFFKLSY